MSGHTPGPWVVFGGGSHFVDRARLCVDGCDLCDGEGGTYHPEESVAQVYRTEDARLIAAAPDLLEALQEARDWLASECGETRSANALARYDAIIARATGGEP